MMREQNSFVFRGARQREPGISILQTNLGIPGPARSAVPE
jgi:hypothetical protein